MFFRIFSAYIDRTACDPKDPYKISLSEPMALSIFALVNVNAPVVATTSWWLHFTAPVVAYKVKKSIPVDFIIYL